MAAIHPQHCDEVKVDIVDPQENPSLLSVKHSKQKSTKILNLSSCKKIFGTIILWIFIYIIACEAFSFGLKIYHTTPTNVILYRYRLLGAWLLIGVGFLGFVFIGYRLLSWIVSTIGPKFITLIDYYFTREDLPSTSPWYQRKQFAKFILSVSYLLAWLINFETGYWLYVIGNQMEKEPVWSRSFVYSMGGISIFGFWLLLLFAMTIASIMARILS